MSMTPTTPNFSAVSSTVKSFWNRPEGSWGKGILVAGAVGVAAVVVFFWGLILPFLIGVVGNTIQLAMLIGVLGVLTSPIWSSRVRLFCTNAFQLAVRWGYQSLIATDPIGMLRNNVATLAKQGAEFDTAVSQLAGSKQRLEADIQANKDAIMKDKSLADTTSAKIVQLTAQAKSFTGNARQEAGLNIQRLQLGLQGYQQSAGINMQTIKAEQPILDQTNKMYDQLCRLRDLAAFKVQSLTQQADMYSKQRATILASQKALGAAGRILKGDPQQLAIVDQTIEYLNNEASDTIGAMNDFNRWSEKYLTDMDIQNGASADEAAKMFSALEQKLNLPDPISGDTIPLETVQDNTGAYVPVSAANDYSKFLK